MGASLESCTKCFFEEVEYFQDNGSLYTQGAGPYFRLRVDWNPIRESPSALTCPFRLTDELVVEALEVQGPRGWYPLVLRHERWKQERTKPWSSNADSLRPMLRSPEGTRFSIPKRFARARIDQRWYLLQVAASSDDRNMENVKADIIDARDTAAWAQRFNRHLASAVRGEDPDAPSSSGPAVQVCAPIGCCVLETAIPQLAGQRHGEVVTLTPYPVNEVTKFILDGNEEFLEMPHAFFHYVSWASGGRELPFDLQGAEDNEGGVLLVDPVLLRAQRPGVQDLLGPIIDGRNLSKSSELSRDAGPSPERFEALHRRCGPLCRTFDPNCRASKAKKVCGMDVHCRLVQP